MIDKELIRWEDWDNLAKGLKAKIKEIKSKAKHLDISRSILPRLM
jgi:hypothetical protein